MHIISLMAVMLFCFSSLACGPNLDLSELVFTPTNPEEGMGEAITKSGEKVTAIIKPDYVSFRVNGRDQCTFKKRSSLTALKLCKILGTETIEFEKWTFHIDPQSLQISIRGKSATIETGAIVKNSSICGGALIKNGVTIINSEINGNWEIENNVEIHDSKLVKLPAQTPDEKNDESPFEVSGLNAGVIISECSIKDVAEIKDYILTKHERFESGAIWLSNCEITGGDLIGRIALLDTKLKESNLLGDGLNVLSFNNSKAEGVTFSGSIDVDDAEFVAGSYSGEVSLGTSPIIKGTAPGVKGKYTGNDFSGYYSTDTAGGEIFGVTILGNPFAGISNSTVGIGVLIQNGISVQQSSVGDGAQLMGYSAIRLSSIGEQAFLSLDEWSHIENSTVLGGVSLFGKFTSYGYTFSHNMSGNYSCSQLEGCQEQELGPFFSN